MAHEFHLPDIGEGLTEATILTWYVEVGGEIGLDEPLVEVETDKAVVDIPSPHAGVVLHLGGAEGEEIAVEALLAVIGEQGEEWAPAEPAAESAPAAAPIVGTLTDTVAATSDGPPQALPAVRRLAAELGVDLAALTGTGPGGRITESDVRGVADDRPVRRVPMSSVRKAIAQHLTRSWQEIPHVTTYGEADAAPLLDQRGELGKPPLEALLIVHITPLLKKFPAFNSTIEGDAIVERQYYDVGIAVDTPDGLVVAVIADADQRSVEDLSGEITRLAAAARERKLAPSELRGQTFTLSNIGAVGGRYGTPIIPFGTSAILSVGRADPGPVVEDGEVVVGRRFPLSLSYDHRVIDGSTGRRFMAAVVDAIESS